MAELFSILYLALFALSGLGISRLFFYRDRPMIRIWLGLTFGMLMLIWLPALFSFVFGFVLFSQLLGFRRLLIGAVCWLLSRKKSLTAALGKKNSPR
jgi:cadmium resistance protein CadD (predicted permease)